MSNSPLETALDQVFDPGAISHPPNLKESSNRPTPSIAQKNGGLNFDRQNLTVKNRPSDSPVQKRTFKSRPGNPENARFTAVDQLPKRHFFYYYNALNDVVLPQLNPMSSLILSVLFRKSHGFNRNWCQASFPELERIIGASRNTIRAGLKPLIEDGWVCIIADGYNEATTYGLRIPVDIQEKLAEKGVEPAVEPAQDPEPDIPISPKSEGENLTVRIRPSKSDRQHVPLGGSKFDGQNLTPCTGSTCTKQFTDKIPDSHLQQYTQDCTPTDPDSEVAGENRVIDNHNDKNSHASLSSTKIDLEESYLKSLPGKKVGEIYRAQDAWDEILGPDTRPTAAKLNQMLQYMRGWYRGENLDVKFRWCLADTKKKRPRDAVAWLISALKHGRYPNIVMSKTRGEGTGSSSLESRPSRTSSVNNPGKATHEQSRLDRPGQTREAAAEREKRRAASPHRELWEKVLKDIGEKILPQSYESWFKPLFIDEIGDTAVIFDAPDQMVADWVEQNYMGLLKTALKTVGIFDRSIVIEPHAQSS